jgi:hypothetical protein
MEYQEVDVLVVLCHTGSTSDLLYASADSTPTSTFSFPPIQLSLVQFIGNVGDGISVRLRKCLQSTCLSEGVGTQTWKYSRPTLTSLLHLCERTPRLPLPPSRDVFSIAWTHLLRCCRRCRHGDTDSTGKWDPKSNVSRHNDCLN